LVTIHLLLLLLLLVLLELGLLLGVLTMTSALYSGKQT
jgi:hypothetical protein